MKKKIYILVSLLSSLSYSQINTKHVSVEAQKLIGTVTQLDEYGPNCYNAVMIAKNAEKEQKFIKPQQFLRWLTYESKCKIVDNRKIKPGDIVTFIQVETDGKREWDHSLYVQPAHTLVFLGNDKVFEKPDHKNIFPYRIYTLSDNINEFAGYSTLKNMKSKLADCINELGVPKEGAESTYCYYMQTNRCNN